MKAISLHQPYLAGVLHGDGWCSPLTIGLRCKDQDFAEAFAAALSSGFEGKFIPRRDERGYWLIRKGNKTGRFNHLRNYQPTDDDERAAWLRGLFDSEGNAQCLSRPRLGPNSFQRRIDIYSTEQGTLEKASEFLGTLGIRHTIRATKNSSTHKGTKIVFELSLQKREAFQAFAHAVGSSCARKQLVLNRIASTFLDPAEAARRGQLKGAATKHARLLAVTLPAVIAGVRSLIAQGVKPTQRNCRTIPGYNSIQRHFRQVALIELANAGV